MRALAPTSSVRALLSPSSAVSQRRLGISAARWLHSSQRWRLAKVTDGKELGLPQDVCFTSTSPAAYPVDVPGNGSDHTPPDERTLKLGKSMPLIAFVFPNLLLTRHAVQLFAFSNSASQPSSRTRCRRRSYRLKSLSNSSPQHIRTYPPSRAR